MRSRPKIAVFLSPGRPVAGERLEVRVILTSHSITPTDGIRMTLIGDERHGLRTQTIANVELRTVAAELGVGQYEYRGHFDLDAILPPSHSDSIGSVEYTLHIHVVIPWWPDRHARYEVRIAPAPHRAEPRGPIVFVSARDGPGVDGIYLEATLDPNSASIGGVLEGAIAVTSRVPIRSLALSLVATSASRAGDVSQEVRRFVYAMPNLPDATGKAQPFSVALPATESPSFDSALMSLRWHLEVRADGHGWGHAMLHVALIVAPLPAGAIPEAKGRRLPAVGSERRAAVWASVAQTHELLNDAASETMTGHRGNVELRIALEQRDAGLYSVASLRWPDAEIALVVRERRFTDLFTGQQYAVGDTDFNKRFFVAARSAEQATALLSEPSITRWLSAMNEVVVESDGAVLAVVGGGHLPEKLAWFVDGVVAFATAVDVALAQVPAPPAAHHAVDAWRAFALRHEARFVAGSLCVRELVWEGVELDLVTEWDGVEPTRTCVVHWLDPELDRSRESAVGLLEGARHHGVAVRVMAGREVLAIRSAGLSADPQSLDASLTTAATLVHALRSAGQRGPYR